MSSLRSNSSPTANGQLRRFGDVVLSDVVHSSPHAVVFRGEWQGRPAAVKLIDREVPGKRVEREVRALADAVHPNVVPLLDCGVAPDGRSFVVSPWIDGEDLRATMRSTRLSPAEQLSVVRDVADALRALHASGVVHRDIKPANIVRRRADSTAVVLDLGHALWVKDARITESGDVIGTAHYAAPEQSAGRDIDERVDIYSLGAVLYELLAGTTPFEGDTAAEVFRCHRDCPLVPPSQRAPDRSVPPPLEDLCMWMMARDRAARLPSARVLRVAVDAIEPLEL